ncbi:MAG TPA: clostripain-related cysteine peptidase [Terriglobales bacterium]|jgi:cysteine peptidase C11 family protein|nr:clostripain-related cysteine peptidase [Terriglobales bacterium]
MLFDKGNPYSDGLPIELQLDWSDFECGLSAINDRALGRVAEWAVLAYMAADCNLAPYMFDDLKDMKSIGSSENVHVMALFDGPLVTDSFFARLNANTNLNDDIILRFEELQSNDPKTLTMALQVASKYPAKHRLLLLGGHGKGWAGLLVDENTGLRYRKQPGRLIRPGSESECNARRRACLQRVQDRMNSVIDNNTEGQPPLDILAFDACYMGSIEAIAQVMKEADLMVVSEDLMPGEGFAYGNFLTHLVENPMQSPFEAVSSIVSSTSRYYQSAGAGQRRLALAAIKSEQLTPFSQALVRLVQALDIDDPATFAAVRNGLERSWTFGNTGMIDLKGFVLKLLEEPLPSLAKEAAAKVLERWSEMVVTFNTRGTADTPNGLSVYAPLPANFDISYLEASNHLPLDLGIWALFLAGYYLKVLGDQAPRNALVQAMERTMRDLKARGIYKAQ